MTKIRGTIHDFKRIIRTLPCPHCGSRTGHVPVDLDGHGEYWRFCLNCDRSFWVDFS